MFRFVVAALLVVSALGQQHVKVKPCDDPGKGEIVDVVATPCTTDPCELVKGKKVTYSFEFISDQDSKTAEIDARVKVFGMNIPVPGLETNLCKEAIKCPVQKGQHVKGSFTLDVPKVPIKKTTIEVKINGDEGLSSCFSYPVVLK